MIGETILANFYSGLLRFFLLAVCTLALPSIIRAQTDKPLPVMPLPAEVVRGNGEFLIDENFGIVLTGYKEPRLERARQRFLDVLSRETGIPLWREAAVNQPRFTIRTEGRSAPMEASDGP